MDYASSGPPDEPMEDVVIHVNPMGDLRVHALVMSDRTYQSGRETGVTQYGTFYEDSRAFTDDPVQGFGPGLFIEEPHDR